jgi:hypothetical protein
MREIAEAFLGISPIFCENEGIRMGVDSSGFVSEDPE